jgi:DNA-binding protein YbaB
MQQMERERKQKQKELENQKEDVKARRQEIAIKVNLLNNLRKEIYLI